MLRKFYNYLSVNQYGYSLMEIIIVLFLLVLMSSFLFSTFGYLVMDYLSMSHESKINQMAFNALDQIISDLKMAKKSSIGTAWPENSTGKFGCLTYLADLNNDGVDESYVYYLHHFDDPEIADGTYSAGPPNHPRFYRLFRYQGDFDSLYPGEYLNFKGQLLAEDVVPPKIYEGVLGSFFEVNHATGVVKVRLRLQKEKDEVIKEKIVVLSDIWPRN